MIDFTDFQLFAELYRSDINFNVSCFFDGGFDWALGDPQNGWRQMGHGGSWQELQEDMASAAARLWPKSVFSDNWRRFLR